MMQLRYDADLLEGAVFLEARRLQANRERLLAARYERGRTRLYEIADPDERAAAFFQFHLRWFRDFGFEEKILSALKLFPVIGLRTATLLTRKAVTKKDEGAELFIRGDDRTVALALRCEQFFAADLDRFLRHELCHIADMLDESFGYSPDFSLPDAPPAELNLLRERYRILWDITIDGRCHHESERAKRLAEFAKAFSHLSEQRRKEIFDRLWGGPRPSHPELVALAKSVLVRAERTPGAPCPLCKFPTFQWTADADLTPQLTLAIQQHFPNWSPAHGVCSRCLELYSLRPLEQPATLYL